jgi:hypothetical protein
MESYCWDGSAITLTALFYFLLRNPTCYEKLQQEIDTLLPPKDYNQEFYKAEYAKIKTLPYLHACIQVFAPMKI